MIYFTGDMHGEYKRFKDKKIKQLKKDDVLVICGDFGFVWSGDKKEQKILQKIGKRTHITLFVPGANVNFDLIAQYEDCTLFGGKVKHIQGNLYAAVTGQIYQTGSGKMVCFGGGMEYDEWMDMEPKEGQMPDILLLNQVLEEMKKQHIDYIASYRAPESIDGIMCRGAIKNGDYYAAFLERVERQVDFGSWYFGRYHRDRRISPKFCAVYRECQLGGPF